MLAKPTAQVCLVSDQAIPNISPVLDHVFRPQHVILVVSEQMKQHASWLENVLKSSAKIHRFNIDHPWDVAELIDQFMLLCDQYKNYDLTLNASCGTKPMTIAAAYVFREYELGVFYVHPRKDEMIWIYPPGQPRKNLEDRIKLDAYIQAYGGTVLSRASEQIPPAYRDLASQLIERVDYYSEALGRLNWYAHEAEHKLVSPPLEHSHTRAPALLDLLDLLSACKIVNFDGKRLFFENEQARFFANGGWLEQYVFSTVNSLKKSLGFIQDTAMSLEVVRGDQVKNEIDVAVLADNKLYTIECKAKKFRGREKDMQTIYKLDSVSVDLGGIQTRALLVSFQKLPDAVLRRAKSAGVSIIHHRQLRELSSRITAFLK
ncbi:MAG: Card1-like endonuclease domain-containing protein [bacterium]